MNKARLFYRSESPMTIIVYDEWGHEYVRYKGMDALQKARDFIKKHNEEAK